MVKQKVVPLSGYIPANVKIDPKDQVNPSYYNIQQAKKQIIYTYGDDVSRWAVIQPFQLNHTPTNSILSMFDQDSTTYYQLGNASAPAATTSIVLDFGILLDLRGVILSFFFNSGSAGVKTLASYYTQDGTNWILINSTTSGTADEYHDHILTNTPIRAFKFDVTSSNLGSNTRISQLSFIV